MLPKCAITVTHEGREKMAGKPVEAPYMFGLVGTRPMFLHEATSNQWHVKHACPSPVDYEVLQWMLQEGIHYYIVHYTDDGRVWCVPPEVLEALGEREVYGSRDRVYLPAVDWYEVPERGLWFEVPYYPQSRNVRELLRP